jgi:hypothetical protein
VSERRTRRDDAACVRALVDRHAPKAQPIRVVQDHLNTPAGASLSEAFPPAEARRLLDTIEGHDTPTHSRGPNMAETEMNSMKSQCLNRRLDNQPRLAAEVAAWEHQRHRAQARLHWTFDVLPIVKTIFGANQVSFKALT